jgi:hypothetical protein
MFGGSSGDKLAAALAAYQRDFAQRVKPAENLDAKAAQALVDEAKKIVEQSGLGRALAPTLIEHTYHWPSWSKREDFLKWVHFPATAIAASEEKAGKETIKGILFTYQGQRHGMRFVDEGSFTLPDGDSSRHGRVDFVVDGETVLGLNIAPDQGEYSRWRWFNLYAFKAGAWSRRLLEIAAHIEHGSRRSSNEWREKDAIERAKNIKL